MVLFPKEAGSFISSNSSNVVIHQEGVRRLSEEIKKSLNTGSLSLDRFSQSELHPAVADEEAVEWIFVVDTLNFCFWTPGSKKWEVTWHGKKYTGYFALCAAINRALEYGFRITSSDYYFQLSKKDLIKILCPDNEADECPLLEKRLECLHEIGLVLQEKYDGKFLNCLKSCGKSAKKLLETVVADFNCFRDEGEYRGQRVALYKRAQILVGDIWACFRGKELGEFYDIGEITMFADYRVPQVLVHFGAMSYSEKLMNLLKEGKCLDNGSEEEIEIRGCSIEAVERIRAEIEKTLPNVSATPEEGRILCNSIVIDHFLWDYRRAHADELSIIPFHRTLSIYY